MCLWFLKTVLECIENQNKHSHCRTEHLRLPGILTFVKIKKSEKLLISRKMVFYFETTGEKGDLTVYLRQISKFFLFLFILVVDPPRTLFMGLDKHESKSIF